MKPSPGSSPSFLSEFTVIESLSDNVRTADESPSSDVHTARSPTEWIPDVEENSAGAYL